MVTNPLSAIPTIVKLQFVASRGSWSDLTFCKAESSRAVAARFDCCEAGALLHGDCIQSIKAHVRLEHINSGYHHMHTRH